MRQAFWKGIKVGIIPFRAGDKCTETGLTAGVSCPELLAPFVGETPLPSGLGHGDYVRAGGRAV